MSSVSGGANLALGLPLSVDSAGGASAHPAGVKRNTAIHVRAYLQQLLGLLSRRISTSSDLTSSNQGANARIHGRIPLNQMVSLVPLDEAGVPIIEKALVLPGKNISGGGVSVFHQSPIKERRVIISFELAPGKWASMKVDLLWCQFTRSGWYESGGRVIDILAEPPFIPWTGVAKPTGQVA